MVDISRQILITGATGCIGSHIANMLVNEKYQLILLSRINSSKELVKNFDNIKWVYGDLQNNTKWFDVLPDCHAVVHSAAALHLTGMKNEKKILHEVNVNGTARLCLAVKNANIQHFIHISSIAAMGDYYNITRDESYSCTPESAYGKSKLESENVVIDTFAESHTDWTIIRPAVTYGIGDRGTIFKIIKHIVNRTFVVFGDGNNKKNFVSAHNVAQLVSLALKKEQSKGQTYIVTDDEVLTINNIVNTIAYIAGVPPPKLKISVPLATIIGTFGDCIQKAGLFSPLNSQNIKNFLHSSTYDISKVKSDLEYIPHGCFSENIKEEIDWFMKRQMI